MTPHINAPKGAFAKTVLMPGDPLRAKFIAKTFLKNAKEVNSVRGMLMYTGEYNGKKISVCGSGMGQPSIGIYAFELFNFYDVENIIRIGTSGSFDKDLHLYDVVLVKEAYSDSTAFNKLMTGRDEHITKPSESLNNKIEEIAKKQNIELHKCRTYSSDVFYNNRKLEDTIKVTKASCVEMESAALFAVADKLNKKAACILTISDSAVTKEETSPEERQEAFTTMMELALELA